MSQAKPEVIEIFYRVLSQELTRSTGHKIDFDLRYQMADSIKPVSVSKDLKRVNRRK